MASPQRHADDIPNGQSRTFIAANIHSTNNMAKVFGLVGTVNPHRLTQWGPNHDDVHRRHRRDMGGTRHRIRMDAFAAWLCAARLNHRRMKWTKSCPSHRMGIGGNHAEIGGDKCLRTTMTTSATTKSNPKTTLSFTTKSNAKAGRRRVRDVAVA